MLANPIKQRPFETNVLPEPLRLQPLISQNLIALSEKLLIETRMFHKLVWGIQL